MFTFTNITTGLLGFMLATASVAFEGAGSLPCLLVAPKVAASICFVFSD